MIAWLAALLIAGAAEPRPMPFDLDNFFPTPERLDGRWVEFDAYVILMRRPGGPTTLSALKAETRPMDDGRIVTICADNSEATVAVLPRRNGLGPLTPRAARPRNAYVGVRIRGILRAHPYGFNVGTAEFGWVGSVDHARIVRLTGRRCLITYPEPR